MVNPFLDATDNSISAPAKKNPFLDEPAETKEPSLAGDIKKDIQADISDEGRVIENAATGKRNLFSTGIQSLANVSGPIRDVGGEVVKRIPGYEYATSAIANAVTGGAQKIADMIDSPGTENFAKKVDKIAGNHPEFMEDAKALGKVLAIEPTIESAKTARKFAVDQGKKAGERLSEGRVPGEGGLAKTAKNAKEYVALRKEGFNARNIEALDEVKNRMADHGDMAFKALRKSGVNIIPEKSQQMAINVRKGLADSLGESDQDLHGPVLKVVSDMQRDSSKGMTIEKLHIYQKRLGNIIKSNSGPQGNLEAAKWAATAQDLIDDQISSLKATDIPEEASKAINHLYAGKALWGQMRSFEAISDIVRKADGDANRMKALLEQLKNNPRKFSRFNAEEKKLIEDASRNDTAQGIEKMLGKFGVNIGSNRAGATGNILPALEIGMEGAKKGGAMVAGGTGAKYLHKLATKGQIERLVKKIEGRNIGNQIPLDDENPNAILNANPELSSPIANAAKQIAP